MLQHIVFGESPFVFLKYIIANKNLLWRSLRQSTEQSAVKQEELEGRHIFIEFKWHCRFVYAVYFVYQTGVDKPLYCYLEIVGSCSFFQSAIYKLLVVACQL